MIEKKITVYPGVVDITDLDHSKFPYEMLIQGKDQNIKVPFRLKVFRDGIAEEYLLEVLDQNDKVFKDQIGFSENSNLTAWEGNKQVIAKELIKALLERLPTSIHVRQFK